jgi:hypothetical protein
MSQVENTTQYNCALIMQCIIGSRSAKKVNSKLRHMCETSFDSLLWRDRDTNVLHVLEVRYWKSTRDITIWVYMFYRHMYTSSLSLYRHMYTSSVSIYRHMYTSSVSIYRHMYTSSVSLASMAPHQVHNTLRPFIKGAPTLTLIIVI